MNAVNVAVLGNAYLLYEGMILTCGLTHVLWCC